MLGVYDSGLGGLTVVRALRAAGIDDDVVYFADQAHAPYGDRSDVEIQSYLTGNFAALRAAGADAVVTACNTSCAVAQRLGWPPFDVPVLDLIVTAGASFGGTAYRHVAVVATAATVRSGAYARAIAAAAPHVAVTEHAAPALVPLVEAAKWDDEDARDAVAAVVAGLPPDVDAVVYGCTHYPMLDRWFAAALPPHVTRIDPALAQAEAARSLARAGSGRSVFLTNGEPQRFAHAVRRWLAVPADVPLDVRAADRGVLHDVEDAEEEQRRDDRERGAGDHLQHGVRA